MATTISNDLAQNLERLVADFVRSSQELVLATVAQALVPTAPASAPSTTTKPSRRTKPSKRAKPSQRRTPKQVAELGERFYEVLCAHPGESMVVLAAKVGSTPRELHRSVALLKRTGRVRSVGQRQATRYFPKIGAAEAA